MPTPQDNYIRHATVLRVIDGDTYVVDVDLGFYTHTHIHVRLDGVDCPELGEPGGSDAAGFVTELFDQVDRQVTITTRKIPERSFERYVAQVHLPDGRGLGGVLIATGHAQPYS